MATSWQLRGPRGNYGIYVAVTGSGVARIVPVKGTGVGFTFCGGGGGTSFSFFILLYSLNVHEWKSTLLGVILGITSFGVEIHSQKSDSNHYFGVDSTILRVDFHSKRSDP